jgi:hypothetical protein
MFAPAREFLRRCVKRSVDNTVPAETKPCRCELEPLTEGSTRPIAETRAHAGICQVRRYAFGMP